MQQSWELHGSLLQMQKRLLQPPPSLSTMPRQHMLMTVSFTISMDLDDTSLGMEVHTPSGKKTLSDCILYCVVFSISPSVDKMFNSKASPSKLPGNQPTIIECTSGNSYNCKHWWSRQRIWLWLLMDSVSSSMDIMNGYRGGLLVLEQRQQVGGSYWGT